MTSSARPRVMRRTGSRSTGRADRWPRGSRATFVPAYPATLQPDAEGSLADGVVVEARLVARLLGLRLLRVDGVVLLAPGRVREPQFPVHARGSSDPVHREHHDGVRPGERLALAGQLIASTASRLERTRRR
jgi:hypothetical protein